MHQIYVTTINFRNVIEHKLCFSLFCLQIASETYLFLRKFSDFFKKEYIFSLKGSIIFLSNALIFQQILENVCNIKYFDNPVLSQVVQCGWKDGRKNGYMNSHEKKTVVNIKKFLL